MKNSLTVTYFDTAQEVIDDEIKLRTEIGNTQQEVTRDVERVQREMSLTDYDQFAVAGQTLFGHFEDVWYTLTTLECK